MEVWLEVQGFLLFVFQHSAIWYLKIKKEIFTKSSWQIY